VSRSAHSPQSRALSATDPAPAPGPGTRSRHACSTIDRRRLFGCSSTPAQCPACPERRSALALRTGEGATCASSARARARKNTSHLGQVSSASPTPGRLRPNVPVAAWLKVRVLTSSWSESLITAAAPTAPSSWNTSASRLPNRRKDVDHSPAACGRASRSRLMRARRCSPSVVASSVPASCRMNAA